MKKRTTWALTATALAAALAVSGCTASTGGSSSGASSAQSSSAITVSSQAAEKKDVDIKIVGTSIGKDYSGSELLIVQYEFTNNTKSASSFTFLTNDTAYQNGVECSDLVISSEIDSQQQLSNVKPGASLTLKVGYKLQDTTTPVEIEITDLFGTKTYLKQTVNLK